MRKIKSDLYTSSEAAKEIGVHLQTLYNWIKDGVIEPPARKAGTHMRFSKAEIQSIQKRLK